MHKLTFPILTVFGATLATANAAQHDAGGLPTQPAAAAVIQRALEAMGGREAIADITSAEYLFTDPAHEGWSWRVLALNGNQFLSTNDYLGHVDQHGSDGVVSWKVFVEGNTYQCTIADAKRVATLRFHNVFHRLVIDLEEIAESLDAPNQAQLDTQECNVLTVKDNDDGHVRRYYFDAETGLLCGLELSNQPDMMPTVMIQFDDWRPQGKIQLFTTLITSNALEPDKQAVVRLEKVQWNVVDPASVQPPEPVYEVVENELRRRGDPAMPAKLNQKDIDAMSVKQAQTALARVANDREKAASDFVLQTRLKREFGLILEHLRTLKGNVN